MMTVHILRDFFLWCTIINAVLGALSFLTVAIAGNWIYKVHSRWFPISRESWSVAMYAIIGAIKVIVLMFNLVPYLALLIIS